uniref:Reverse transcriptase domain-containing protein n=1 Tax=Trichuris muris TaxID=70415 RepID=A0A5S6R5R9_TRIMR
MNGCGENVFILNTALAVARGEARELCMATLDVAKAFDTVSHFSIRRALARHKVSAEGIELLMNLLQNSTTYLEHSDGNSDPIPLTRGVKQGDPMSPLLFSMVLDELLDDLTQSGGGFTFANGVEVNCLAFADDLLLLSDSKAGLQSNLLKCYRYFTARSLTLNVQKCCSLRLYKVPRARSVNVCMENQFYLDPCQPDTVLPVFTATEFIRYLGVDFNPFGRRRDQIERAQALLDRVCKAPMKPQQKIEIIRTHLLPRLLYTLSVGNPLANTASEIDKRVRQSVKELLRLPPATLSNDYFYLPKGSGGLGFLNLQETADTCALRLMHKMSLSEDRTTQYVAELWINQRRRYRLMRRNNVASFSEKGIRDAKRQMAEVHRQKFLATYQGYGHQEFSDRRSNGWITGEGMTGHRFITAIQVRTSLIPTRMQILRGRAEQVDQRVLCRRCGTISGASESLCHISQSCAFSHGLITRRHDAVVSKLGDLAEASGFRVVAEPILRVGDRVYQPDLLLTKGQSAWVLDVAIPWEGNTPLVQRYDEKVRKYACLKEAVLKLTGTVNYAAEALVDGQLRSRSSCYWSSWGVVPT